jgi:hypothetical protein
MKTVQRITVHKDDLQMSQSLMDTRKVFYDDNKNEVTFYGICSPICKTEKEAKDSLDKILEIIYDQMTGDKCYVMFGETKIFQEGNDKFVAYEQTGFPGITTDQVSAAMQALVP